jgi:presenilin-like A22 family membrane protease
MGFATFILYSLTQFLGLFIAQRFLTAGTPEEILQKTEITSPTGFLLYLFVVVFFIIALFYFRKRPFLILKPFIALLIWSGLTIVLQLINPDFLIIWSLFSVIITWLFFKLKQIWFHNLIIVFCIAAIAGLSGLNFSPLAMIIILTALAIYDYWMIFSRRHIIHFAKEFLKEHLFLGIIAPKNCNGYFCNFKKADFNHNNFILLSGVDLAFPLMFASSILKQQNLKDALIVVGGGIFGLFFTKYLFKKTNLPALIPLTIFLIISYLFTLIF